MSAWWPNNEELKEIRAQLDQIYNIQNMPTVKPKRKSPTRPKILAYRISFTHTLQDTWMWECPIWFNNGMFADVWIKGIREFGTEELCKADVKEKLKLFGVTKRTRNLNLDRAVS